jgi:ubiquitin carboxyl-terminal hydrolase 34
MIMQASPAVIEATHVGIVDRCIDLLTSSATKLSRRGGDDDGDGGMTVDYLTDDEREETTRKYCRALSVLDQFVKGFRTRPFYASTINGEPPSPRGEVLDITLRLCGLVNLPTVTPPKPHPLKHHSLM